MYIICIETKNEQGQFAMKQKHQNLFFYQKNRSLGVF